MQSPGERPENWQLHVKVYIIIKILQNPPI